jgi:hypothetical protein
LLAVEEEVVAILGLAEVALEDIVPVLILRFPVL